MLYNHTRYELYLGDAVDEQVARNIRSIQTLAGLAQFEKNVVRRSLLTDEMRAAIRAKSAELGRALITQRTGLDLSDLSPAEEKIVRAVSEYVGLKTQAGSNANRTLSQLEKRGLIDAAEAAVAKAKPTQGFTTLVEENLADLSYEQIIIDHPEEFSRRALWYARRTLGVKNESEKPPAPSASAAQERTEELLRWFEERTAANGGHLRDFTNAEAAAAIGIMDMRLSGRVFGNIQSRIDYGCYTLGFPPLGLAANEAFAKAWDQRDRTWAFPIEEMQAAARARIWIARDFELILAETETLPGQAHISWNKEHTREEKLRAWAFGLKGLDPESDPTGGQQPDKKRNPIWSRDELILALDLYLRHRESPPSKESPEVAELSSFLAELGKLREGSEGQTFRNANGVYMKMMNFRRFDPEYTVDGKVGLVRGNRLEEVVWKEFADDRAALADAVATIRAQVTALAIAKGKAPPAEAKTEAPYWVFVCNPKKWAIDKFIKQGAEHDAWGIRPSDRAKFAPGQLGIVRVGVDRRSIAERDGNEPLKPGIYALCEIESEAFAGTGANDGFWADGAERAPGWPTVKIRYLRTYLGNPLTIETLRDQLPGVSPLLLDGFQASSFPISSKDFHAIIALLGEDPEDLSEPAPADLTAAALAAMQEKYKDASPEVKERVSKYIERGAVGGLVKKANGYKCQVCEALGVHPFGFKKKNGEFYVEAHHVMPVSSKEVGALATSNVMTLCANHHRQMHYGGIEVAINETTFDFAIEKAQLSIPRFTIPGQLKPDTTMWVFGYGSLMWGGWESKHGCKGPVAAQLSGYCRAFDKASILNWGSNASPGPTLNLIAKQGATCHGYAFEFPGASKDAVLAELKKREGGFELRLLKIRFDDGREAEARVPIYAGRNLIRDKGMTEVVGMVRAAKGKSGACIDYVKTIAAKMKALGIDDPVVTDMANALDSAERLLPAGARG